MKDAKGQNHYAVEPFVEIPLDAEHEFYRRRELDADTSELVEILMDENGLCREQAISVLASVMEHRAKIPGFGAGGGDVSKIREHLDKAPSIQERVWQKYFDAVFKNHGDPLMNFRTAMLLMDFKFIAGAENLGELVQVCGGDVKNPSQYRALKQTVNKCLSSYQKKVPELSRIPGQRGFKSRRNMEEAQEKIWRGEKQPNQQL